MVCDLDNTKHTLTASVLRKLQFVSRFSLRFALDLSSMSVSVPYPTALPVNSMYFYRVCELQFLQKSTR